MHRPSRRRYGCVLWPAAVATARRLARRRGGLAGVHVLEVWDGGMERGVRRGAKKKSIAFLHDETLPSNAASWPRGRARARVLLLIERGANG
jgi:hypothetical protein